MKKIFIFLLCIFLGVLTVSAENGDVSEEYKKYADPKISSFFQKVEETFPDVEEKIAKLEGINDKLNKRITEIDAELYASERFTPCCQLQNQLAKFKYIHSSIKEYQIKEYLNNISISSIPDDWKTISLPTGTYKHADLKFAFPANGEHNSGIDVGGKSGDDFYNSQKTKRLFVTQYYVGKCAEIFSNCAEEEYVARTGKEDFNLFVNYLEDTEEYDYSDEYDLANLGEKALVSKDQKKISVGK